MKKLFFITASLVAFAGCKHEPKETAQVEKIPGIVLENMDTTVSPKEDFYNYVNGNWMKTTQIPEDRTRWGGFSVLRKSTDADVLQILADAKASGQYDATTDQAKALAIFDSKLDTVARDKAGITPLQPALEAIAGIKDLNDLQTVLATNPSVNSPFFGLSVFPDLNNSKMNAVYMGPAGLGLPERDYYLEADDKSKEIRGEYKKHIVKMLQMLGDSEEEAIAASEKILELETVLAEPRLNKVQRRDVRNLNNPKTIAEADEMLSNVDLKKMI
ncbi:MAG: M13 family metallopeptidase N-terminal domain-containing protein, partial [Bacteroidota bacterium]